MNNSLVFLHPFPLSSVFWAGLKPIPGYSIITPDFPGFGTAAIKGPGYALSRAVDDLNSFLTSKKSLETVTLIGISMGGYWAFEYLRQYPERVEKLVLISTRAGIDKPEGRQNRLNMADKVEKEGTGFMVAAMTPGLLGKTTLAEKPEVKAQVEAWISQATAPGVALAQRAMADRRDQTDLLPQIKAKTLILAGAEDALIPSSESIAMSKAIPNSQLVIWDHAGHLLPIEAPEKFQKLLEEFLRS